PPGRPAPKPPPPDPPRPGAPLLAGRWPGGTRGPGGGMRRAPPGGGGIGLPVTLRGGPAGAGGASGDGGAAGVSTGAAAAAAAASTIGSRRSPSWSARRRTRSASGSSMLDEWLLTPILSRSQRSRTTWFSTPSSRASSYTRIFLVAKLPYFSLVLVISFARR